MAGTPEDLIRVTERALDGQGPLTKQALGDRLELTRRPGTRSGHRLPRVPRREPRQGRPRPGPVQPPDLRPRRRLARPRPEALSTDRDKALAELARRLSTRPRAGRPRGPRDVVGPAAAGCPRGVGPDRRRTDGGRPRRQSTVAAATRRREVAEVPVVLVPAFDEYLLGWRDRSLTLSAAHAKTDRTRWRDHSPRRHRRRPRRGNLARHSPVQRHDRPLRTGRRSGAPHGGR